MDGCLCFSTKTTSITDTLSRSSQGATCYLNSLLQAMYLTHELRDNLFRMTDEELNTAGTRSADSFSGKGYEIECIYLYSECTIDQEMQLHICMPPTCLYSLRP